jgi:hypothetical protein
MKQAIPMLKTHRARGSIRKRRNAPTQRQTNLRENAHGVTRMRPAMPASNSIIEGKISYVKWETRRCAPRDATSK